MSYSVTIAAYQAEATIGAAVRSALVQELAPVEVIVVDDGSEDRTAAEAEAAGARLIRLPDNRGAAVARNAALAAATAGRVAFLDADDTWLPDHLRRLDEAFDAVPDAVAAFGGIVKSLSWGTFEIPLPFEAHTPLDIYGPILRRNQVPMSASAVDRRLALRLGGFDEECRVVFDYEFWLRVAHHGPFVRARGATTRYPVQQNQLSANYRRLLEESWKVRLRSWRALTEPDRAHHRDDIVAALDLDLRRSWNRRRLDEIDYLFSLAEQIPQGDAVRERWRGRRRVLPWLRLPLMLYDRLPRGIRTTFAKARGAYDYDLVR